MVTSSATTVEVYGSAGQWLLCHAGPRRVYTSNLKRGSVSSLEHFLAQVLRAANFIFLSRKSLFSQKHLI